MGVEARLDIGVLDDYRGGAAGDRVGDEVVAVGALAAQRDEERSGADGARIGGDRVDRRRERAGDARAHERRDEAGSLSHQCVPFGERPGLTKRAGPAAGITPAWSIAARASSANTGAATCEP